MVRIGPYRLTKRELQVVLAAGNGHQVARMSKDTGLGRGAIMGRFNKAIRRNQLATRSQLIFVIGREIGRIESLSARSKEE